jgi:hypothetical protein
MPLNSCYNKNVISQYAHNVVNRIDGVMGSVLDSSAVDHRFEPRSGHIKDYRIGMCCFSAKSAALRWKSKVWLARNQNNMSELSDISTVVSGFATRLKRRVPLVEQELLPFRSTRAHPRVRVTPSLVLYVCFVDHCLSFCLFSSGHCVVCSSSIYRFWLPPFGIFKLFLRRVKW